MTTPRKEYKTPIKGRRIPSLQSPQTPQTPQTPNVDSTIRRRVSDILVNLHKFIQKWELNNQASFNTANTLCNLYGQWSVIHDGNELEEIITDECKRKFHIKLINTREDLIKDLKLHQKKMKELIAKINRLVENLKAIYYLGLVSNDSINLSMQSNESMIGEANVEPVIFTTWTAEKFHRTAKLLVSMYAQECQLKHTFYDIFLKYRVGDSNTEGTSVLSQCVNVWLHQPYIDSNAKMYLDSMLLEAELK